MTYHFVYPNGGAPVNGYSIDPTLMSTGYPNVYNNHRRSYSPESFSSDSESSDDYEYRGRMITRETRCPRDVVRAPTPPPIIKRVVERAPTPEAPIMERVIIRPQAQEIVERVIEQPRTPPPRIIEKEMREEAPPPIVRTRVIKVDRPFHNFYSQPGSPYDDLCNGLSSLPNGYRAQSIAGSVGRPAIFSDPVGNHSSFSSASSFEYIQPAPMASNAPPPPMMMMMPSSQQQQQIMHRPMQIQSSFVPQNYMYPVPHQGIPFGYCQMMQQGRMIPNSLPMTTAGNGYNMPVNSFVNQLPLFNPMNQQMVY